MIGSDQILEITLEPKQLSQIALPPQQNKVNCLEDNLCVTLLLSICILHLSVHASQWVGYISALFVAFLTVKWAHGELDYLQVESGVDTASPSSVVHPANHFKCSHQIKFPVIFRYKTVHSIMKHAATFRIQSLLSNE